jgi:hypothetical protein
MRLRDFSFGAGAGSNGWFESLPRNLRQTLEGWARWCLEGFQTFDASSVGVNAGSIAHQAAAANIDLLCELLERVLREISDLQPEES